MYYLKTIPITVFSMLFFIFSACTVEPQSIPPEIALAPSAANPENSISLVSPKADHNEERHLPMYSSFEYFNKRQSFPGFQISETQEGNSLFYKLENYEIGVIVLIDENEETARISYNNKELELKIPKLFSSVDTISLSLFDLTEDGVPDLYYAITTGGTGVSETTPIIVNMETMEIIPVEDYVTPMLESLDITLISLVEKTATYKIKSSAEAIQYGSINVLGSLDRDSFIYSPDRGTDYASLSNENGILSATVGFTVPAAMPSSSYLGYIRGVLTYDAKENSFKVYPPYEVNIVSPPFIA